jgi:hypothetical protein
VVALLVEIPHTDLSEVTRMVLVHVRSVVMLSTSKTSSTRMLPVLAYSSVTGGDVSATTSQLGQHLLCKIQVRIQVPITIPFSATERGIFSKMTSCRSSHIPQRDHPIRPGII